MLRKITSRAATLASRGSSESPGGHESHKWGANAISRPRTQPDPPRIFAEVKSSPLDSVRRQQTPKTGLDFPDAEEVPGACGEQPAADHVSERGRDRRRQLPLRITAMTAFALQDGAAYQTYATAGRGVDL